MIKLLETMARERPEREPLIRFGGTGEGEGEGHAKSANFSLPLTLP